MSQLRRFKQESTSITSYLYARNRLNRYLLQRGLRLQKLSTTGWSLIRPRRQNKTTDIHRYQSNAGRYVCRVPSCTNGKEGRASREEIRDAILITLTVCGLKGVNTSLLALDVYDKTPYNRYVTMNHTATKKTRYHPGSQK